MIESLLVAVARVSTMKGGAPLSNATGFFFERSGNLFLVTARHVVVDEASNHSPDQLAIEIHTDPDNIVCAEQYLVPLYDANNVPLWREGVDSGGRVDVAAIKLDRAQMPAHMLIEAFNEHSLVDEFDRYEVGTPVLIVGFPLGFHDELHHLPVARHAVVASAFGIRFQGQGYFLTDAHMHRGASGAPVVARAPRQKSGRGDLAWLLLGIHAAGMDMLNRDPLQDARLGLNCAWYADILMTLTAEVDAPAAVAGVEPPGADLQSVELPPETQA